MAKRHTDDMTAKLEKFERSTREGRGGRFTGTRPTDEMAEGNVSRASDGVRHVPMDLIEKHSDLSAPLPNTGYTRKGPSK